MTTAEFARQLGMTRQNVPYHLKAGHVPGACLLRPDDSFAWRDVRGRERKGQYLWVIPRGAVIKRKQRGRPTIGETTHVRIIRSK